MDDSIQCAGQAGIKTLYHYQDFQSGTHADRLADVLKNNRIYCSNPADFNDPWDCKPYFDPDLLDNPDHWAATAEFFISTRLPSKDSDKIDHAFRTDLKSLKWALHQFCEHQVTFIIKRWGVYCMSPDPSLALMWSHYSRNHRGICLEFGTSGVFYGAVPVQYQKAYPQLLLHDAKSRTQMILAKSDVWTYENEYRLIGTRATQIHNHPLKLDGNYLPIAPTDLRSIIIGCQADKADVETIKQLVAEHAPHVQLRRAVRSPKRYDLVIEPNCV